MVLGKLYNFDICIWIKINCKGCTASWENRVWEYSAKPSKSIFLQCGLKLFARLNFYKVGCAMKMRLLNAQDCQEFTPLRVAAEHSSGWLHRALTSTDQHWPLLTTVTITDHHWPLLTITGHHWPSLTTTGHRWPLPLADILFACCSVGAASHCLATPPCPSSPPTTLSLPPASLSLLSLQLPPAPPALNFPAGPTGVVPTVPGASQQCSGASRQCPGASPRYSGASPRFLGASPRYPGASPQCSGASPHCWGASPQCPGASLKCSGASLTRVLLSPAPSLYDPSFLSPRLLQIMGGRKTSGREGNPAQTPTRSEGSPWEIKLSRTCSSLRSHFGKFYGLAKGCVGGISDRRDVPCAMGVIPASRGCKSGLRGCANTGKTLNRPKQQDYFLTRVSEMAEPFLFKKNKEKKMQIFQIFRNFTPHR